MSTKDISRFLFQPKKHYVGMRMQQGRVTLDSDHNEGAWHDDEDQRRTLLELIGPQGSPDGGFFIGYTLDAAPDAPPQPIALNVNPGTTLVEFNNDGADVPVPSLYLMPGTMYVGGMRVELEEPEHIAFQSDYLQSSPILGDIPSDLSSSGTIRRQFFFLNVWEQCVTAVEDEELLERALGGPDTSVRVRRMRRVEYLLANEGEDCAEALERALDEQTNGLGQFDRETGELLSPGRLWIDFAGGDAEETCAPCHPDPSGRYLGAENQAIRIMLVDEDHFVWAYDNASPLYRVTIGGVGDTPPNDPVVTMLTLAKDEEHWPLTDRVVEILPWSALLDNGEKIADEIGVFCRVSRGFVPDGADAKTFTIDRGDAAAMAELNDLIHAWDSDHPRLANLDSGSEPRHFYVRFWHQVQSGTTPVLIPTSPAAALGSTGLVPNFTTPGLRGDFWIAALRPETPDRIVPFDLHTNTAGVAPHGPRHFYAPLAMIHSAANVVTALEDCRKHIVPLTDTGCCTFVVGDGIHSLGHFSSIQAAVNALPPQGGKVCVRAGTYVEEVSIGGRNNVTIEGCGEETVVVLPSPTTLHYVFQVGGGSGNVIRSLRIHTTEGAVSFAGTADGGLIDVHIVEQPKETPATATLVDLNGTQRILLRALRVEVLEATAIHAFGGIDGVLENLRLVDLGNPQFDVPLLHLLGSSQFRIRNSSLLAKGRIAIVGAGVFLLRLEGLDVQCLAGIRGARYGLVLDNGNGSEVASCSFDCHSASPDAAVRIIGAASVHDCRITADGFFWGGIHVAGGTGAVLANNFISGGTGHGITLGSVTWITNDSTTLTFPGPGIGQLQAGQLLTGDLSAGHLNPENGLTYFPTNSQGTSDTVIRGNRIERMRGNGISVLTVLGLSGQPFIKCENLVIEGNLIAENLVGPFFDSIPIVDDVQLVGGSFDGAQPGSGLRLPVIPFGGIVLATLTGRATIRNNEIRDNARPGPAPALLHAISGIFVLLGEGVVISGNNIAQNGVVPVLDSTVIRPGLRAGIGVVHATTALPDAINNLQTTIDGGFGTNVHDCALRVTNNVVRQPEGRALFAVAAGSVDVVGNFLASQGFHGTASAPDTLALGDVVFIQNLGKPWEALTEPNPPQMANFRQPSFASPYFRNQLDEVYGYAFNTLFFAGQGGHTLFNDNQVVYDWLVQRFPGTFLSYFAVAVISLDHVGMNGNQFAFRMNRDSSASAPLVIAPPSIGAGPNPFTPELLLSDVFAMGATVQVTGNRVSDALEDLESANLSILTYGILLNTTALNQTSRCVAAFNRQLVSPLGSLPTADVRRFRIEALNLVMASQKLPSEEAPGSVGDPVAPCDAFYTGSIFSVMSNLTQLLFDKRIPNT
jgi:hypothetical protein